MGLVDAIEEEKVTMTWNNCRREGRVEARLDRFYVLEGRSWLVGNRVVKVELGEVLSDHKPFILEGRVEGEVSWRPGYYKVNTSLISTKEGQEIIKEVM
eukprot:c47112_g1_i1 orf=75-371(+)